MVVGGGLFAMGERVAREDFGFFWFFEIIAIMILPFFRISVNSDSTIDRESLRRARV